MIAMGRKKVTYSDSIVAYDVETTSTHDGNDNKVAWVYSHAFSVDGTITVLRTWEEYHSFIEALVASQGISEDHRLVIWVHNLAHEYAYLKAQHTWKDVFAINDKHRVARAVTSEGIEFRCSYLLTNKSLESVGKDVGVAKLKGDLDYSKIRTPETHLTEKELGYIKHDVMIIDALIKQRLEQDTMSSIPMTQTGYVRRKLRTRLRKDKRAMFAVRDLTLTPSIYVQSKVAYSGGYTHANARYAGKVVPNVDPYDLASAYPCQVVTRRYPMSNFIELNKPETVERVLGKLACLIDVTLTDVSCRYDFAAISESKCQLLVDPTVDNGRVVEAAALRIIITDVEWTTIRRNYNIGTVTYNRCSVASYGYLPRPIVDTVLDLYVSKTDLKNVEGEEVNYRNAKECLNSVYGCMGTNPVRTQFELQEDGNLDVAPTDFDEALRQYNKSYSRPLWYPWGAWVTSYTREQLLGAMMDMMDAGVPVLYCDTDSIYAQRHPMLTKVIEKVNNRTLVRTRQAAEEMGIDEHMFAPKDPDGKAHPIGLFEQDNHGKVVDLFKTLGAKRYAKQTGEEFAITVAGLSKSMGKKYVEDHGGFEFFTKDMVVPAESSGRIASFYSDDEIRITVEDYLGHVSVVNQIGFMNLEPTSYKLTLATDYEKYIQGIDVNKFVA